MNRQVSNFRYRVLTETHTGLGFSPQPIWLDHDGTSVSVSPVFGGAGWIESSIPRWLDAHKGPDTAGRTHCSRAGAHARGDLVIPRTIIRSPRPLASPGNSVVVSGERIGPRRTDAELNHLANGK